MRLHRQKTAGEIHEEEPVQSLMVQARAAELEGPQQRNSFAVLVEHLLGSFVGETRLSTGLSAVATLLQIAVGLALPPFLWVLGLAPSYSGLAPFLQLRPLLQQVGDHAVLLSYAFAVSGISTLLAAERFLPTLEDVRFLAILPVSQRRLFGAKVMAGVLYCLLFLVVPNMPAAIFLVGFAGAAHPGRQLVAHGTAVLAAGGFAVLAVLSVMSLVGSMRGRFRAAAESMTQGVLLAALLLQLLLAPVLSPSVGRLASEGAPLCRWLPACWFTGLYEVIWRPALRLEAFERLALWSVGALLAVSLLFLLMYPMLHALRGRVLLEGDLRGVPIRTGSAGSIALLLRSPRSVAAFCFTVLTLRRVRRFTIWSISALCLGVAFSLSWFWRLSLAGGVVRVERTPEAVLETVALLVIFLTANCVFSLRSSVSPEAAWIFTTTNHKNDAMLRAGVTWQRMQLLGVVCGGFCLAGFGMERGWAGAAAALHSFVTGGALIVLLTLATETILPAVPFTMRQEQDSVSMPALYCGAGVAVAVLLFGGQLAASWLADAFLVIVAGVFWLWLKRRADRVSVFCCL